MHGLGRDEAAMRAFMLAPPHRKAMVKLLDWCDEAYLGALDAGECPVAGLA